MLDVFAATRPTLETQTKMFGRPVTLRPQARALLFELLVAVRLSRI
jgi:hypothetical protein